MSYKSSSLYYCLLSNISALKYICNYVTRDLDPDQLSSRFISKPFTFFVWEGMQQDQTQLIPLIWTVDKKVK